MRSKMIILWESVDKFLEHVLRLSLFYLLLGTKQKLIIRSQKITSFIELVCTFKSKNKNNIMDNFQFYPQKQHFGIRKFNSKHK